MKYQKQLIAGGIVLAAGAVAVAMVKKQAADKQKAIRENVPQFDADVVCDDYAKEPVTISIKPVTPVGDVNTAYRMECRWSATAFRAIPEQDKTLLMHNAALMAHCQDQNLVEAARQQSIALLAKSGIVPANPNFQLPYTGHWVDGKSADKLLICMALTMQTCISNAAVGCGMAFTVNYDQKHGHSIDSEYSLIEGA